MAKVQGSAKRGCRWVTSSSANSALRELNEVAASLELGSLNRDLQI